MPVVKRPITAGGAIVEIGISTSFGRQQALKKAGQPVPNPIFGRGLIDTGASCTCIDPSVAAALGLVPTGICQVFTASSDTTPDHCRQYDIGLGILMDDTQAHRVSLTIPVIETLLVRHGYIALIGRDVLAHGVMVYSGKTATIKLSF